MQFNDEATISHPQKLEQDWLYPSDTDYIFLGVFLFWGFLLLILLEGVGLLIDVVAFVGCWIQLLDGRIYYVVGGIKPRNFWNDRILKANLWEAEPVHPRLARLLRPPPPTRRLAINVVGRLALIYNKRAKTDTLLIGGLGSDNVAHDIYAQARITERVGDAIKRIASVKNYEVIVGFLNMRRPSSFREMLEIYAGHIHPDFLPRDPETKPWPAEEDMTDEERGDRNIALVMEDLLVVHQDDTRKNTMAVTITIRRDDLLRKAAKKGGSMADLEEEQVLIQEIAAVAEEVLEHEIGGILEIDRGNYYCTY